MSRSMGVEAERLRLEVVAMKAKGDETEPQKLELLDIKMISKIDFIDQNLLKYHICFHPIRLSHSTGCATDA